MRRLLHGVLKRYVVRGRLTVIWPDGTSTRYGGPPGAEAAFRLRSDAAVRRLALQPTLAPGECFMDGSIVPEGCGIYDVLDVLLSNAPGGRTRHPMLAAHAALGMLRRRMAQFNPTRRARRNVAHHYDLNGRLYSLFLDRDRQYSCGYFPSGDETLEEAQAAKKRHIAAKLRLTRPDLTVLDIGSGWGGMALTLARDYGARVTGITLSSEQLAESRARAAAEGLADRVDFELMDYRAVQRPFDRIVSVGMFEHVGTLHYREFFDTLRRCLQPDGVALLHAIGRSDGPGFTNRWIEKYIFPGGYCPALSEVFPHIERADLIATDVEVLRLHYAETLRHWRRRFVANRDAIETIYDAEFCRMFEFYLASSELTFRRQSAMVFQIQLTRDRCAVPLTRDYMVESERAAAEKVRA